MSLVRATFIVNSQTGKEQFVENLPSNYQFAPYERLVTRDILSEDLALLKGDKYKNVKVYRYSGPDFTAVDKTIPPKGLDYKIGLTTRLFEDPYINGIGFLERMDFYAKATYQPGVGWIYTDKVVTENYMYTIDPGTKYVVARTKQIVWYREDDSVHPDTKIMFKPYSVLEMEEEAVRRRSNIIAQIKIELALFGNWVISQQYPDPATRPDSNEGIKRIAAPFNTALRNFIDAGDRSGVIAGLNTTTEPFFSLTMPKFGKTVKQFVIDRLV